MSLSSVCRLLQGLGLESFGTKIQSQADHFFVSNLIFPLFNQIVPTAPQLLIFIGLSTSLTTVRRRPLPPP